MKARQLHSLLAIVAVMAFAGSAFAYELSWWTIDGGGGTSSGGTFTVSGTIGQPDAATSSGGSFVLRGGFWGGGQIATAVGGEGEAGIPRVPRLAPAHPNPFNPRVSLRFDLPDPRTTTIRVYDLAGRLVRTLVSKPLSAGTHDLVWDGRDDDGASVASGVFVVQVRAGNFAARQKVTLLK